MASPRGSLFHKSIEEGAETVTLKKYRQPRSSLQLQKSNVFKDPKGYGSEHKMLEQQYKSVKYALYNPDTQSQRVVEYDSAKHRFSDLSFVRRCPSKAFACCCANLQESHR